MYIVEVAKESEYDYSTVYKFVGDKVEVAKFRQNMGSLVLSAVRNEILSDEEGYLLLRNLLSGEGISLKNKKHFINLVNDSIGLINDRLRALTHSASNGAITMRALAEEYNDLIYFDPDGLEDARWLTKSGLLAEFNEDSELVPNVSDDDLDLEWGKNYFGTILAAELGLSTHGYQYELVYDSYDRNPKVLSGREHYSLGRITENGTYEPVVTVLDDNYLAMQYAKQLRDIV